MKEEKEIVNPYEFAYDQDQLVGINGNSILSLMGLLEQIIDTQPKIGALMQYPEKSEKVFDDNGNLIKVDIEWKEHNKDSFFYTAAAENGGVLIVTDIALKCQQALYGLTQLHQSNINNKIAKKIEELNADTVFRA